MRPVTNHSPGAAARRAYVARFHGERRAAGLCRWCKAPVSEKSTIYCEEHRLYVNEGQRKRAAARNADRKARGVCWTCGAAASKTNKAYCEEHRLYQRRHEKQRHAKADPLYVPMEQRSRMAARRESRLEEKRAGKLRRRAGAVELWQSRPDLTAAQIGEATGLSTSYVYGLACDLRLAPRKRGKKPASPGRAHPRQMPLDFGPVLDGGQYLLGFEAA